MNDIEILENLKKEFLEITKEPYGEDEMPNGNLYKYERQYELDIVEIKVLLNLINRVKELEKIVEAYNVIPNDYISKDMKIVIADREYFNNGILKETCLPKSKIKEKIEELNINMAEQLKIITEFGEHEKNRAKLTMYKEQRDILQELLEE